MKKCPFCGALPEEFGKTLDEKGNAVDQVVHPIIEKPFRCPLNMLVFKKHLWDIRYLPKNCCSCGTDLNEERRDICETCIRDSSL